METVQAVNTVVVPTLTQINFAIAGYVFIVIVWVWIRTSKILDVTEIRDLETRSKITSLTFEVERLSERIERLNTKVGYLADKLNEERTVTNERSNDTEDHGGSGKTG